MISMDKQYQTKDGQPHQIGNYEGGSMTTLLFAFALAAVLRLVWGILK